MPELDLGRFARALEQPAYIAVGFGVLGFQRAQVYRRAWQRRIAQGTCTLADSTAGSFGGMVSDIGTRLPPEARDVWAAACAVASDAPAEARELAKEAAAFGRFALQLLRTPARRSAYP